MKVTRVVSTAALSLLLGGSALMYAQDKDDAKPPQAEPRQEEARPPQPERQQESRPAQDEAKPTKQDDARPAQQQDEMKPAREQETPKQEDAKPSKDEKKQQQEQEKQEKQEQKPQKSEQTTQRDQHADNKQGGRIPDDKFRSHFGQQHKFVINHPTVVSGQPRFQYGGYWFNIVDVWPVGWAYTDDCYIDYIDGEYFLFDLVHPGVRVSLFVVL
jgi:hypothetical protein